MLCFTRFLWAKQTPTASVLPAFSAPHPFVMPVIAALQASLRGLVDAQLARLTSSHGDFGFPIGPVKALGWGSAVSQGRFMPYLALKYGKSCFFSSFRVDPPVLPFSRYSC